MSTVKSRPDSPDLIIEDIVTATMITNMGVLLKHGSSLKETMFLRKRNWLFVSESLDLHSADRFDTLVLLQVLGGKGDLKDPRADYESLVKSLNDDRKFEAVFPFWLNGARKRYVRLREAEVPDSDLITFEEQASHSMSVLIEAMQLGGVNLALPMDQVAKDFRSDFYERRASNGSNLLTTGFRRIDREVILDPGRTIVVAARPGVGKTSLAVQFALRSEKRGPVLINSLEMSYDQMVGKMLESTSVVPGNLLKLPWTMAEDQIARMEDGLTLLTQTNLYVCRLFDLIKLEAAILQCRPILVIVDYIQLYREPSSWRGSRADYITMVAGEMAKLSRKYKTIFMVLCQLNRRGVDDPDSHNLKDAGGIEEAADSIWILSRPDKDEESRISLKTIIGVRKNRMGVEFDEDLLFDGETQRFVPWDETEAEKFWLRRLKHMRDLT